MDKSMMSAKVSDGGRSNYNTMTSRRMKMAYEYTRITQVFSLSAVPPCWIYPVSLLLQAYCEKSIGGNNDVDLAVPPNFPDEDTLSKSQDLYYSELVPGREYQTKLPTKNSVQDD